MSHEELIALGEAMIRATGTTQGPQPGHSPLFGSKEEEEAYKKWYGSLTEKQREDAVFQDPKIKEFLDSYIKSLATGEIGWIPLSGGPFIISTDPESSGLPIPAEEIASPPYVDY